MLSALILATLLAPALIKLGVTPMAAHMFVMYNGILSMITPPVAFAAYAAATRLNPFELRYGLRRVGLLRELARSEDDPLRRRALLEEAAGVIPAPDPPALRRLGRRR